MRSNINILSVDIYNTPTYPVLNKIRLSIGQRGDKVEKAEKAL